MIALALVSILAFAITLGIGSAFLSAIARAGELGRAVREDWRLSASGPGDDE